ncbi:MULTISPECIES: hypothetical protein [unclassified Clostridioides]|uniref:hypothetical protein n=1 Tax=unclassified Clostridioides TaxID=2635829 RepID=UPI001D11F792|nr:hypothetical protein [Clostridioides sp. ES-S-0145-01]MCC0681959.1 hypothetical protein [Clostridioides sp. ES-S-0005-03]MCC0709308.1 hypothetical protein [Clostridioides sp. ES-S-0190-01]UDN64151.1 hypothetical protein IC758_19975 [Clostridioides sp. ES-W-0016-02]
MSKNNNAWVIRLLASSRDQTEEMCLDAVSIYGKALQFADNQTYLVCLKAIEQDKDAIECIRWEEVDFTEEEIKKLNILSGK